MTKTPYHPKTSRYPRDLIGYGAATPDAAWPGGARAGFWRIDHLLV